MRERKIRWTYHVNMRLKDRFIPRESIIDSVDSYEIIEKYPQDKYLPSYLIYSHHQSHVFHILFATDVKEDNVRIITAYYPNPDEWQEDLKTREAIPMRCHICGSSMTPIVTDLPFKVHESTITILKNLPVLQCEGCTEYLLDDTVMQRVDRNSSKSNSAAELEVVRYAA